MDALDRKFAIKRAGLSNKLLAKELKVTPQLICTIVNGNGESRRVKEHIAQRLNIPVAELFPEQSKRDMEKNMYENHAA